jgi:NAD(P)-dependent dehydrogenase (short-subunit alcohol dehydrogenase family)
MSSELFDLKGQVAFVSGASRGLGEHFAEVLARAGADVVVTSRDKKSLDLIYDRIEGIGGRCLPVQMDVTDQESIARAVEEAMKEFKKIDVLMCNAGCNRRKPAVDVTWDDWDYVIDTNLKGAFFLAQEVAKESMLELAYGRVIMIGSVTSVNGYAGLAPYGASRGGTRQMVMSLADDWGPSGVTVNCLAPGWFKTAQNAVMYEDDDWVEYLSERIPLRRPGKMEDLDGALLFLASESSRYVTGQTLLVDGGISTGRLRAMPKGT